jgi:hypothetical protein
MPDDVRFAATVARERHDMQPGSWRCAASSNVLVGQSELADRGRPLPLQSGSQTSGRELSRR